MYYSFRRKVNVVCDTFFAVLLYVNTGFCNTPAITSLSETLSEF